MSNDTSKESNDLETLNKIKRDELKIVTILASDLSIGQSVAQTSHGMAEFSFQYPDLFQSWKNESNSVVILEHSDLFKLKQIFLKKNFIFSEFIEPDLDDKLTCLTIYGTPEVRKYLSYLPLFGKSLTKNFENLKNKEDGNE